MNRGDSTCRRHVSATGSANGDGRISTAVTAGLVRAVGDKVASATLTTIVPASDTRTGGG